MKNITFINIRLKQLYRELSDIGLFRTIFLIAFLALLIYALYIQAAVTPYYATGVYFAIVTLIHISRPDKLFLKMNFDNYKFIYGVEYFLLSLPLIICLLFHYQWIALLLLFFALFLLTNLEINIKHYNLNGNIKLHSLNTKLQRCIPDDSFEWKSGSRKYLFYLIPIWLLAMGTSFFIASVPIAILLLGGIQPGVYEKSESLPMVLAFEMKTKKFLFHKIKLQIVLFSVIAIPLILAFVIFHPERWYIPVAEYIILATYQIYLILTKYAFYRPNTKSHAVMTFGTLGALGAIIPVFLPLVWLLGVWFYIKSFKNLNFYLHDFD